MSRVSAKGRTLRHPYDNRAYVWPVLALIASFAVAVGTFYLLSGLQSSVESGGVLPEEDGVWAVAGERWGEGGDSCSFSFAVEPGRDLALAVVRPSSGGVVVRANGSVLSYDAGRFAGLRQVHVYLVPEDLLEGEAGEDLILRFEVAANGWSGSDALYIGSPDAVHDVFWLFNHATKICALTMLAVMVVYALSLFLAKRSETYLIPFVAYTSFLIVWIAFANVSGPDFLPGRLFNFIQVCGHFYVAYIPSAICVLLSGLELPRPLVPLVRWYSLLLVPAAFGTVGFFIDFGATMAVMTVLCFAFAGCALVRSAALGRPGVMVLVLGFGITIGFKLAATLVDAGLVGDSIVLYTARKARLLNVPIVMAVMLYLNQLFARNFRKTEDMNILLEGLVEQRTAELRQQQGMRLGMMVNIFHDLRGPLFTMQKCVEVLGAGPSGEAGREVSPDAGSRAQVIDILADRTAFLARLIEDLFTAAKLEDGDCLLAEDPVDVPGVLEGVVRACGPLAVDRDVRIDLACKCCGPAGGLATWGDRRYLARAFENLVVNAVHHAPAGTCVDVRAERDGDVVRVSVHNGGDPIAPADLSHVFERYYRRNTKAPEDSSGIGLSIVRAVAERHRGSVGATSSEGGGTVFAMELPLLDMGEGGTDDGKGVATGAASRQEAPCDGPSASNV